MASKKHSSYKSDFRFVTFALFGGQN